MESGDLGHDLWSKDLDSRGLQCSSMPSSTACIRAAVGAMHHAMHTTSIQYSSPGCNPREVFKETKMDGLRTRKAREHGITLRRARREYNLDTYTSEGVGTHRLHLTPQEHNTL